MTLEAREELEGAQAEAEAHINVVIELLLSDAELCGRDIAQVLMRVRSLFARVCEISGSTLASKCHGELLDQSPLGTGQGPIG